jgi:hypothetical protein
MDDRGYVPLRTRAVCAWRKERPKRIAQLLNRAALMLELREKLEEALGRDLPIHITIDLMDRPIATVEELRFTLTNNCEQSLRRLMLLDTCPRCETERGEVISSLADLGQLFEGLGGKIYLGCSECLGISDEELTPSTPTKNKEVKTKHKSRA